MIQAPILFYSIKVTQGHIGYIGRTLLTGSGASVFPHPLLQLSTHWCDTVPWDQSISLITLVLTLSLEQSSLR